MQPPNHAQRESALAIEDFGDARAPAQNPFEILSRQPLLLHAEADGRDRIGRVDGVVLRLIGFDECRENVAAVTFRRARAPQRRSISSSACPYSASLRIGLSAYMSDRPDIDPVIIGMPANPFDPQDSLLEIDRDDESVGVAPDIEDDRLAAHDARRAVLSLDIGGAIPSRPLHFCKPGSQRCIQRCLVGTSPP